MNNTRLLFLCIPLIIGALICAACASEPLPRRLEDMRFRPELLTLDEALSGNGRLAHSDDVSHSSVTDCGPENDTWTTRLTDYNDVVYFTQSDRWFTLGVFDNDPPEEYQKKVTEAMERLHSDKCLMGREAYGEDADTADWHVYPLDFGEGIVAYRAVGWRSKVSDIPPPEPTPQEGLIVRSTARALGVVDGHLVEVQIDQDKPEPPSESDLRALWNAQIAKLRYLVALEKNKTTFGQQSGSMVTPASD